MQTAARIYALSKRNIILRYKNSIAGFLWGFLKPLLYLLIFIVIFSSQFGSVSNYVLYATSGLIFWFFFSNVTSQSVQNIVSSAGLIKSINIPVILYPLAEMLSEIFNFLLTLFVFLVVMYWFGIQYNANLLLVLPCLVLFGLFCMGITLALSSVNVFLRDAGILWNTIQPALFYMTPIAYPEEMIPARFSFIIHFNPIYTFIKLGRSIFYNPSGPSGSLWLSCFCISVVTFLIGLMIFNKLKNQFISAI
jgi:ABC-2 type transport system permease protein